MRTPSIAIIGDHFMRPDFFVETLVGDGFDATQMRTHTLPWPDEPMEHGYHSSGDKANTQDYPGLASLREYQGDVDQVLEFIGDSEVFITHLAPMPREAVSKLQARGTLKLIAVSRGGPVSMDMKALHDAGIHVVNAPGRNASAVAEFTIGAILAETRLIRLGHEALRHGRWRGDLYRADRTGQELRELTVGLIGYGHIGKRVCRLLRPFKPKILVTDPYVSLSEEDKAAGVRQCSFEELLRESDIVSVHCRVSAETTKIINAEALAMLKPSAYLINTARGPLMDYDALYDVLHANKIKGAMLETFAEEPVPENHKLLTLENVTLTPHIAGASIETIRRATRMLSQELLHYVKGEPFNNPISS